MSEEEEAQGGRGGVRKRSGRRRAVAEFSEVLRRQLWQRRKGGKEEEGQSWRCRGIGGGGGGQAAEHVCRAIRYPERGAYDFLVGRVEAPVLRGARLSSGGSLPR